MKKIKKSDTVYLSEYDVHVNKYLTSSQIQAIANAMAQFDTWAEREQNKAMLTLFFATDITKEEIEKTEYSLFEESGLIEAVCCCIENYSKIDKAVEYEESTDKALRAALKEIQNEQRSN